MSESMKIPYNTWGGVTRTSSAQTSRNITISAGEVPYNYAPLTSNLYISSDLTDEEPIPLIMNMKYYARNNIPNYSSITEIPSGHLPTDINTSAAQNWSGAFSYCNALITLPAPFYNTSNATNMGSMFIFCYNLSTVPDFDTGNVTDMSDMFSGCANITTVPNFDTGNVTDMSKIFSSCRNIDTGNVTDMSDMFYQCRNLTTVPNFDTSKVTNMSDMFYSCNNLTTIPNFDTSNVTDMSYMFYGTNITSVPNFDTSNVTNMTRMFTFCYNLTTIPIFNINNVTRMTDMFSWCNNIQGNLYIESNNVTNTYNLFASTPNYTKNIYCHANSTTYNTIYANMGNNTYNSNWNAYLKTFEDPIGSISQIDSIQIDSIPDGEIYQNTAIFRSPVNTCAVYIPSPDNRILFTSPNFKLDPYTDYNFKVEFMAPTASPTDPVDPLLTPMNLQIYAVSNTSNICIANTSGIFLPSGMNTINIYINGYYPKIGDPEPNINICNIN